MSIVIGDKLQGKVTGITKFGAFIELPGGVTGLVHISEVADNYVKAIEDHLKLNDIVTVKVLQIEPSGKIALSIRKAVDQPPSREMPPRREHKPHHSDGHGGRPSKGGPGKGAPGKGVPGKATFEDKVSRFLKDSEERISSLRRNTDSKRGGRGGRRD
jgi:S1 RNA binding domain protein